MDGRCGCPICPDCRPGKPCSFCSGSKSCPSCNKDHPEHQAAKLLWEMQSFNYKPVDSEEELAKFVTEYKPKIKTLPLKWKFFVPDFIPAIGDFPAVVGACTPPRPAKADPKSEPVRDRGSVADAVVCRSSVRSILCSDPLCNHLYPARDMVCPRCGQCPPPASPWDLERMAPKVVLMSISNLCVRKRTAEWDKSTAVLKGSLVIPSGKDVKGRRRWSFQIVHGNKIIVGLVTDKFDPRIHGSITSTKHGWGYEVQSGKTSRVGESQKRIHTANLNDSTVDVEVDLEKRTLRFYVDGVDKGVAFENLPTDVPLSAAVSLFSRGDKVSVVAAGGGLWQSGLNRVGTGIVIDGLKLRKKARGWEDGTAIIRDPVVISSATQRKWFLVVDKGEQHTIGVATDDYNPRHHSYINKTHRGWGFYQGDGKKGHNGSANADYGEKYAVGDLLAIEIRGTALHFWINDVDQGKAYDLPLGARIWPAVSLYEKDDAIRIDEISMLPSIKDDKDNLMLSGATPDMLNGTYTRNKIIFRGCNVYSKKTSGEHLVVRRAGTGSIWVVSSGKSDATNEWDLFECAGDQNSALPPTGSWSLVDESTLETADSSDRQRIKVS